MKILIDVFPVLLFFIAYKFFGIYAATVVAIIASVAQVSFYWMRHRSLEKMHIITLILIVVLGGATLIFHNELFIKWKPTAINWAFAVVFLSSQFIAKKKPLIKTMMEKDVILPDLIWKRLNLSWVIFFTIMGCANLFVVYQFDTNAWVNFKFFGVIGLTMLFVIIQAIYLTRHIKEEPKTN